MTKQITNFGKITTFATLAMSLFTVGCLDDAISSKMNSTEKANATFEFRTAQPLSVVNGFAKSLSGEALQTNKFTLNSVLVNVGEIEFEKEDDCEYSENVDVDELDIDDADDVANRLASMEGTSSVELGDDDCGEIEIKGNYLFDLLTGQSTPALPEIELPVGKYTHVEISIEEDDATEVTFEVEGVYHSVVDVPFKLALEFDQEIVFENPQGLSVSSAKINAIVAELDATQWFESVDIEACLNDAQALYVDGVLVIDEENQCKGMKDQIKQNIKNSGNFVEDDEDDDYEDESDEDDYKDL